MKFFPPLLSVSLFPIKSLWEQRTHLYKLHIDTPLLRLAEWSPRQNCGRKKESPFFTPLSSSHLYNKYDFFVSLFLGFLSCKKHTKFTWKLYIANLSPIIVSMFCIRFNFTSLCHFLCIKGYQWTLNVTFNHIEYFFPHQLNKDVFLWSHVYYSALLKVNI